MSGPRVTSGTESKQDYGTPSEFIAACESRFGKISFDLAAHAGNAKHKRYFAPTHFFKTIEKKAEMTPLEIDSANVIQGIETKLVKFDKKKGLYIYEEKTLNVDPDAYGMDAFTHSWAEVSERFGKEHKSGKALLWDNCEFNDIPRWSARHLEEMRKGANSLLLTPMTTANWFRDFMAGKADVYELSGRLSFDGKNVFAKDCRVTHYHKDATGALCLWDWQNDKILEEWKLASCDDTFKR